MAKRRPDSSKRSPTRNVSIAGGVSFDDPAKSAAIGSKSVVIETSGGAYIAGKARIETGGGDFVGRDNVTVGSQQDTTVAGFLALLKEIRLLISKTALDLPSRSIIEGNLRAVEDEAKPSTQNGPSLVSNMESMARLVQSAETLTENHRKLLILLEQGMLWARQIF